MKKLSVLLIGIFLLSLGCTKVQSYTKPDVDFSKINKIALIKLGSPDTFLSQVVTDQIALGFRQKGFNIIVKEQLKVLIDENVVMQSGLTESDRKALSLAGVDGVIVGTVRIRNFYEGRLVGGATSRQAFIGGKSTEKEKLELSVKMFDTQSGDVIWSANIHDLDSDELDEVGEGLAKSIKNKKKIEE